MFKKVHHGLLAILFVIPVLCGPWAVRTAQADAKMTGLPELTQEELQWQNKHHKRVKKIKLNKIALERINQKRKQNGRWALTEEDVEVAPEGAEIEAAPGATADTSDSTIPAEDIPGNVDNSQLKYFPPIRSQGSLPSCGSFNGTYYAMTHMWALANDLDRQKRRGRFSLKPQVEQQHAQRGQQLGDLVLLVLRHRHQARHGHLGRVPLRQQLPGMVPGALHLV